MEGGEVGGGEFVPLEPGGGGGEVAFGVDGGVVGGGHVMVGGGVPGWLLLGREWLCKVTLCRTNGGGKGKSKQRARLI